MTAAPRPVVYTAQSKQYFYCRDAVCEYVFNQGGIPLNPFRVFDYFLNDRVPRKLVREGNLEVLRRSDEVWVFGETLSDGVLVEIAQAAAEGKPVRYFSIDNRPERIRELPPGRLSFEQEVYAGTGLAKADLLRHLAGGAPHMVAAALGRHEEVRGTA
jgi:hypothetical protein